MTSVTATFMFVARERERKREREREPESERLRGRVRHSENGYKHILPHFVNMSITVKLQTIFTFARNGIVLLILTITKSHLA